MGIFTENDTDDFNGGNYSDTNNYSFDNADSDASLIPFNSDTLVEGDGTYNTVQTVTDMPQSADQGGYGGSIQNLLGSVGSIIGNAPKIGTALGTAVGTAENNIKTGIANYNGSSAAASSGNSLAVWWANASTTDKMMIGLAIVGIIVALEK